MKKKALAILIASAMAFAMTGCGGTGTSGESSTDDTAIKLDDAGISDKNLADEGWAEFLDLAEYKGYMLNYPDGTVVEDGMIINIDYSGSIDGVAFDGGTAEDTNLELGSETYIEGFEEQIVGHKSGEEFDINVTFPEDYGVDELNGQEAVFAIKINYAVNMTVTDALIDIVNNCAVKSYPKDLYDEMREQIETVYTRAAETYSMTLEEILSYNGIEDLEEYTKQTTKTWLAAKAVMDSEGVAADSDEYKDMQAANLAYNGYESMEDAVADGLPESYIEYQTDMDFFVTAIEDNAK